MQASSHPPLAIQTNRRGWNLQMTRYALGISEKRSDRFPIRQHRLRPGEQRHRDEAWRIYLFMTVLSLPKMCLAVVLSL